MFHSDLTVTQVGIWESRTVWQVKEVLLSSVLNGLISCAVPCLMFTDFASVPRHYGLYEIFGGRCNKEALPHDYGYKKGSVFTISIKPGFHCAPSDLTDWAAQMLNGKDAAQVIDPPKHIVDLYFRQLMIEEGEPAELYNPMYEAVSLCGNSSYHVFDVMDKLPCDKWDVIIKEV